MDKNAIKKFAIWARKELIGCVVQKAMQYGITQDNIIDAAADSVGGKVLTDVQKNQRRALISQIYNKSFEEVMEEIAYTWFNRFIALRFMEINGYLPTRVRVFTNADNRFEPQILEEALHLDLDGLDMEKVYQYKEENDKEELYKYLLITQCNALSSILPGMFQRISDYTELLLPDNLLREGRVIERMISLIPEEDWKDAVQIIGWLYQYYNAEKKDEVFAALKKNVKITKENIPAATQLFTPDWIVRYMVENSLGRIYIQKKLEEPKKLDGSWLLDGSTTLSGDRTKNERLFKETEIAKEMNWKYYLPEAEQDPEVQVQLSEIRKEYAAMTPEQIKCIDPCCGSGHILVYLFDVLVQIYESYGYTTREAVESIVKNNLYGLDIDDRAAQLAYFAVMMKARQYDRRFFSRQIQPNVYAIRESNSIDKYALDYFCNGDAKLQAAMDSIITEMHDAKEYGSILNITPVDFAALYARFDEVRDDIHISREIVLNELLPLVQVAEALAQKYDVVCTNPPYMTVSNAAAKVSDYVKKFYPDGKADLFAVFIDRCGLMTKETGFQAMITQHTWMFLGSYENLREKLFSYSLINLLHFGIKAFEEIGNDVVQTCAFVFQNIICHNRKAKFCRLVDVKDSEKKEQEFHNKDLYFERNTDTFKIVPGCIFAYWGESSFITNFRNGSQIERYAEFTGSQNITGNNEKYLRYHWEVNSQNIGQTYWVFYAKGGDYRKYYGNLEMVIDWREPARRFYSTNKTSNLLNEHFWFREGITYSAVTSRGTGFRYLPPCCIFDKGGPSIAVTSDLYYLLALLNSKVAELYFQVLNPSINLQVKDIKALPILIDNAEQIEMLTKDTTNLAKQDWDSFETSYTFLKHPLVTSTDLVKSAYFSWKELQLDRFNHVKSNETITNELFKTIYGLRNLTIIFEERDIPIQKADLQRDIKSLISYAVGCMFGRYSLDVDGLAYAGGEWDNSKYITYPADKYNIIPICDDEYFDDDVVGRFVKFIETVYGSDTLEENLKFIADALGGKGQPREVIRNYFLNDFYKDHCKIYQKRPIYWLFDSGKKNGFKALIYMHRYQPDTIARIRTDYVHEQQSRYRTAIADMENRIAVAASTSERVKLNKALTKLNAQDTELRTYEEKIHHLADQMISIDLDDGVKVNYAKFQDVLAKIK